MLTKALLLLSNNLALCPLDTVELLLTLMVLSNFLSV